MASSSEENDISFIESELVPEMVHNRCFCERDSREFVELESVAVEKPPVDFLSRLVAQGSTIYRVTVVIQFSGEPHTFHVIVKLLPEDCFSSGDANLALAYDAFLNEEILCNKAIAQYRVDCFPKFYAADMGRYGRPVVVVEDLERKGFKQILDRDLSAEEAEQVAKLVGTFHGRGMSLKRNKFTVYREFIAKFQEITFAESVQKENEEKWNKFWKTLNILGDEMIGLEKLYSMTGEDLYKKLKERLVKNDFGEFGTICQGLLLRENLWFRKVKDEESKRERLEVRVLEWHRIRHGPGFLDFAAILVQCSRDNWPEVFEAYVDAWKAEEPDGTSRDALRQYKGDPYAVLYTLLMKRLETPQKRTKDCKSTQYSNIYTILQDLQNE